MLLMLKVATLTKSLSVFAAKSSFQKEHPSSFSLWHYFTGGKKWKNSNNMILVPLFEVSGLPTRLRSGFTTEAPLSVTRKEVAARLFFPPLESC
jgi:hypothetical protein